MCSAMLVACYMCIQCHVLLSTNYLLVEQSVLLHLVFCAKLWLNQASSTCHVRHHSAEGLHFSAFHIQPMFQQYYFTVVSESIDCSGRDGAKQPIVCVHRSTKAFLKQMLVFSLSPSEHQATLFQQLSTKWPRLHP